MTTVPQSHPKAGDPMTEAITAYIGNLSTDQKAHVATLVGRHTPPSTCPSWCGKGDECPGDHFGNVGRHVSASVAHTPIDPEEPVVLPLIETQIWWDERGRGALTIALYDVAHEIPWEFDIPQFVELLAAATFALRKVREDHGAWLGADWSKVVENIDAIRGQVGAR